MRKKDRPIATHIDLENGPLCVVEEVGTKSPIDPDNEKIYGVDRVHTKRLKVGGVVGDCTDDPRYPSSRDWNMPTVKCSRRTCVANYGGRCTMPSLIEIGPKGCKGYHKRKSGKKK